MRVLCARATPTHERQVHTDPAPERGSAGKLRGSQGGCCGKSQTHSEIREAGPPGLRGRDVRGAAYPNAVLLEAGFCPGGPWRSQRRQGCFWHPLGRDRGAADPPTRHRPAPSRQRSSAQVSGAEPGPHGLQVGPGKPAAGSARGTEVGPGPPP